MRFVYWGRQLGMSTGEVWCTPLGELADMIAVHQIASGAKEKKKTSGMSVFDIR